MKNSTLNTGLLNTRQAAHLLGLSKSTLDKSRVSGNGPPYMKICNVIRYGHAQVLDWAHGLTRISTTDQGASNV